MFLNPAQLYLEGRGKSAKGVVCIKSRGTVQRHMLSSISETEFLLSESIL